MMYKNCQICNVELYSTLGKHVGLCYGCELEYAYRLNKLHRLITVQNNGDLK